MGTKWFVAALLAAASLGCVEDLKTSGEKKGAAEKVAPPPEKASKPGPEFPQRKKFQDPPGADDADPIIAAAHISSARVAEHEERIDAALTAMNEDLRAMSAKDPRALDLASERLLPLVKDLRRSGDQILEKYPKVKADLAGIVKASANVKLGYARVKELYLDKADAETGDLRARYRSLAEMSESFIRSNAERAAGYSKFASDLDKAVAKVERHVNFLSDFEQFLRLNPGAPGAKDREEFLAELGRFADHITRFGETLTQFRNKARDGAVSKKLRGEHELALAALERGAPPSMPAPAAPTTAGTPVEKVADGDPPAVASAEKKPSPSEPVAPAPTVRYEPVTVTRCVPTLVPVTCYTTRGRLFRRTYATTHYEWRNQFVTETVYARAN